MDTIREAFPNVRYREHALDSILHRDIDPAKIKEAIYSDDAEVIESNPDHWLGPCYLVLGWWNDRKPLHILIGLRLPSWVITVWDPSIDPEQRWEADFKTRRRDRN